MDSRNFIGLEATHNRFRWKLPVTPGISTTGGFMFGGSGLGAAISALEGTSGRECVWATAQYLSYAQPGEVVDIDVTIAVEGHQITQARAVCHVADREILTVNAALGDRPHVHRPDHDFFRHVPRNCSCRRHRADTAAVELAAVPHGTLSRIHLLPGVSGLLPLGPLIPELEYLNG